MSNSLIWGTRPISAAIFTAILIAAFGWWGLLAGLPLVVIIGHLALRTWRGRRRPVETEMERINDAFWAAKSAELAHDPDVAVITSGFSARWRRRPPRR